MRARDKRLERQLTALAALAAGEPDDGGLSAYADHRALPGGVRPDLDPITEAREELADCRNYLVWGIERIYDRVEAGDPEVLDEYVALLGCLQSVISGWVALAT